MASIAQIGFDRAWLSSALQSSLDLTTALMAILTQMLQCLLRPAGSGAKLIAGATGELARTRCEVLAEKSLLRQLIIVLRRYITRPRLHRDDRLLQLVLGRWTRRWQDALRAVRPETLPPWHRDLFVWVWKRKSRPRGQPKRLAPQVVALIHTIAKVNVLCGAEGIRDELLKLSIRFGKRTIRKYIRPVVPPGTRDKTWNPFIRNRSHEIWACDVLHLYDGFFRPIFAVFSIIHGNRDVVPCNVTRCPTDPWAAQQLQAATPYGERPTYLVRGNAHKFGRKFTTVAEGTGIEVRRIPPSVPNLNAICERFPGSVRRECLDHVVILSERELRCILREYVDTSFTRARPHQGLRQGIPVPSRNWIPLKNLDIVCLTGRL